MRKLMLIVSIVCTSAGALADAPAPVLATGGDGRWHAESWADAVATLPCSAFQKKSNGQWTMPGRIDLTSGGSIVNMTFGPDPASRSLDQRCGVTH